MTKRETVMLILDLYKHHNSEKERFKRFHLNKKVYRLWRLKNGLKDTAINRKIFKKSDHYKRTLTLEEFTKKMLKEMPEIQFGSVVMKLQDKFEIELISK